MKHSWPNRVLNRVVYSIYTWPCRQGDHAWVEMVTWRGHVYHQCRRCRKVRR